MSYTRRSKRGRYYKTGCYVATWVYGSYDCPEVWTLRRFRDYTLDSTWYGRAFIKLYYAISPTIVKFLGNKKWFKNFWRVRLDKMVAKLNENGVEGTYYKDKYWLNKDSAFYRVLVWFSGLYLNPMLYSLYLLVVSYNPTILFG